VGRVNTVATAVRRTVAVTIKVRLAWPRLVWVLVAADSNPTFRGVGRIEFALQQVSINRLSEGKGVNFFLDSWLQLCVGLVRSKGAGSTRDVIGVVTELMVRC
jgi:hypothetical protein